MLFEVIYLAVYGSKVDRTPGSDLSPSSATGYLYDLGE